MVDPVKLIGHGFNAAEPVPHWPEQFPDPAKFAKHLWEAMGDEIQVYDLETACAGARVRSDYYDALQTWAQANVDSMSDAAKLAVADVLFRPRPRSAKGKHDQRDHTLRQITYFLRNQYGMKKTHIPAFLNKHIVWHLTEATIADIID